MAAVFLCIISFIVIMLRWRGRINVWESFYIFPASLGVGMLNSSQFTGLAASVEKSELATAVSTFYLSQQIGLMIGAGGSAALLRRTFRDALMVNLSGFPNADKVSGSKVTLKYSILPMIRGKMKLLHGDPSSEADHLSYVSIKLTRNIINDTKYTLQLSWDLQAIALSSYAQGFIFVSSMDLKLAPCHVQH